MNLVIDKQPQLQWLPMDEAVAHCTRGAGVWPWAGTEDGRSGPDRFHVRGFVDEGTTTTPFDMVVRNRASRYHLVIDALNAARRTPTGASELKAWCEQQLLRHERYVVEHLQDMPKVRDWSLGDWAEQG